MGWGKNLLESRRISRFHPGRHSAIVEKGVFFLNGVRFFLKNHRHDLPSIGGRSPLLPREGSFQRNKALLRETLKARYSPDLLIAVTLIAGLNILDAFFTMIILDLGGREVNPIVQSAIHQWGEDFWIWKFVVVSPNLILLCLGSHLKYVKAAIFCICSLYVGVVIYQLGLLSLLG